MALTPCIPLRAWSLCWRHRHTPISPTWDEFHGRRLAFSYNAQLQLGGAARLISVVDVQGRKLPTTGTRRKSSSLLSNSHLLCAKVISWKDLETTRCTIYFTYWAFFSFLFTSYRNQSLYLDFLSQESYNWQRGINSESHEQWHRTCGISFQPFQMFLKLYSKAITLFLIPYSVQRL